uniref:Ribosomal protein S4 n=1 Tax=Cyanophora paradoxa TaxID=2762 RepID=A0A097PBM0_CYAPA|nr:ribosomal protein S4 [Cyanophora paradoxa]
MSNYKIEKKFKRVNFWLDSTQCLKFKERLHWKLKKRKKLLHKSKNIWFNLKLYIKKIFKSFYPNLTKTQLKKYIGETINQYFLKKNKNFKNLKFTEIYHILESRLDTILLRTHIVKTPSAARQLIVHKGVFVDNCLIKNPGYLLSNGQIIHIKKLNVSFLKIQTNKKNNQYVYKKFQTILKKQHSSNYYKNFLLNKILYKIGLPSYIKFIIIRNKNYNYYMYLFNTPRLIEIPYPNKMWIQSICKRRTNKVKLKFNRVKKQKFKKNKLYKLKIKKRKKLIVIGTRLNTIYTNIRLPKNLLKKKYLSKKKQKNINKKNQRTKKNRRYYYKKYYYSQLNVLNLIKKKNNNKNKLTTINKKKFKIKKKVYNKYIKFIKSFKLKRKLKRKKLKNKLLKKNIYVKKVYNKKKNLIKKSLFQKKKKFKKKLNKWKFRKLKKKQKKEKIRIFSKNFFNILPWFFKRLKKNRLYMKK